ncbi:MAG: hypothetical protein DRJ47_06700 [Thermoprotei archaeon]|nr:MAG: hypothetical protein DRJ47_06700 [Thermoprotei archaeon]
MHKLIEDRMVEEMTCYVKELEDRGAQMIRESVESVIDLLFNMVGDDRVSRLFDRFIGEPKNPRTCELKDKVRLLLRMLTKMSSRFFRSIRIESGELCDVVEVIILADQPESIDEISKAITSAVKEKVDARADITVGDVK